MERYRYEIHCHTSEASKCGRLAAADLVRLYKKIGYTGVIITDHFFNGNCAISNDIPWTQRLDLFSKGTKTREPKVKKSASTYSTDGNTITRQPSF